MSEKVTCLRCGSVDDYHIIEKSGQKTAYCNGCGKYIKNIPYSKKLCFYFGKYKGVNFTEFNTPQHMAYLQWVKSNPDIWNDLKPNIQEAVNQRLNPTHT